MSADEPPICGAARPSIGRARAALLPSGMCLTPSNKSRAGRDTGGMTDAGALPKDQLGGPVTRYSEWPPSAPITRSSCFNIGSNSPVHSKYCYSSPKGVPKDTGFIRALQALVAQKQAAQEECRHPDWGARTCDATRDERRRFR